MTRVRKRRVADPGPRTAEVETFPVRPTSEEIARRAYEIYRERDGREGSELNDWLQAERELSEVRDLKE